jgi:poly-beta-hydroxyalkanoate depolymerase
MRLDIYRRAENGGKFSYLAVPETLNIPEEVTSTDWQVEARAVEVDDHAADLKNYSIDHVSEQIAEKGYAVTSLH